MKINFLVNPNIYDYHNFQHIQSVSQHFIGL